MHDLQTLTTDTCIQISFQFCYSMHANTPKIRYLKKYTNLNILSKTIF